MTTMLGETRYGLELARLVAGPRLRRARRRGGAPPVLLIPGFMAGDASLAMLRSWLRRRGHRVARSGIRVNMDCAEQAVGRLRAQAEAFAADCGRPLILIGQSRGGALGRATAVRAPESVSGLVMLGSPVLDPLAVSPPVLRAVRSVARLGDAGVPGVLSSSCGDGPCCVRFRRDLAAPLPRGLTAVAIYSRSDAIVDWRACLDPQAKQIEIASSHIGMSVNAEAYRALERVLDSPQESAWSG